MTLFGENAQLMVRPVRLVALLGVLLSAVVALAAPGSASARLTPAGESLHVVVVDRISDATWAELAHRGAGGLLRPSYGPSTNPLRAPAPELGPVDQPPPSPGRARARHGGQRSARGCPGRQAADQHEQGERL